MECFSDNCMWLIRDLYTLNPQREWKHRKGGWWNVSWKSFASKEVLEKEASVSSHLDATSSPGCSVMVIRSYISIRLILWNK